MTIRLQRYLADAMGTSRRRAEELVAQGRVAVDGAPAGLGDSVDPEAQRVTVDGERVTARKDRVYLVLHKPRETICSERDPQGRRSVFQLLPPLPVRVHAVGRLDFLTEGLLIFTNDGQLTRELTRRALGIPRVYEVKVQGGVPTWALERLVRGVRLEDGMARAREATPLVRPKVRTNAWVRVVMDEGRYREVRRMFQAMGFQVLKLKRVQFGPIRLGSLPLGAFRHLKEPEVHSLFEAIGAPPSTPEAATASSGRLRPRGNASGRKTPSREAPGRRQPPERRPEDPVSGRSGPVRPGMVPTTGRGRGVSGTRRRASTDPRPKRTETPRGDFEAIVDRAVRQAAAGRRPKPRPPAMASRPDGRERGRAPGKGRPALDSRRRTDRRPAADARRAEGRKRPARKRPSQKV